MEIQSKRQFKHLSTQERAVIEVQCIGHLRRYVEGLLTPGKPVSKPAKEKP